MMPVSVVDPALVSYKYVPEVVPHWKEIFTEVAVPSELRLQFNCAELAVTFVASMVVTDGDVSGRF